MIPVSVIVTTKDEASNLPRCLAALDDFGEVIVVDSHSMDGTADTARAAGAVVVLYKWNGQYPKKRQWCLDHLPTRHEWIFFIDADEVVTPELAAAIRALFAAGPGQDGYFVRGRYVSGGRPLRFGLHNNKLALFRRGAFSFPVIDDLDLPMGEIEGHYQPVGSTRIGQIRPPLLHYADEDPARWIARHEKYALWEAGMIRGNRWPADPVPLRQAMKRLFRALPARGLAAFIHAYLLKGGILSGAAGWRQARDRRRYYNMVAARLRAS